MNNRSAVVAKTMVTRTITSTEPRESRWAETQWRYAWPRAKRATPAVKRFAVWQRGIAAVAIMRLRPASEVGI
jgi:hypothetical protein